MIADIPTRPPMMAKFDPSYISPSLLIICWSSTLSLTTRAAIPDPMRMRTSRYEITIEIMLRINQGGRESAYACSSPGRAWCCTGSWWHCWQGIQSWMQCRYLGHFQSCHHCWNWNKNIKFTNGFLTFLGLGIIYCFKFKYISPSLKVDLSFIWEIYRQSPIFSSVTKSYFS